MTFLRQWFERHGHPHAQATAPEYQLEVFLLDESGQPFKDSDGAPLAVEVTVTNDVAGLSSSRYTDGSGYSNHELPGASGDLCTFSTNGVRIVDSDQKQPEGPQYYRLGADAVQRVTLKARPFKRSLRPVEPVTRGPLKPFPQPVNYRTTLPYTPPPIPTRDFLRGDAWGVVMEGAPWVPGASSEHPERILSWFVDRYDRAFQEAYLTRYAGYGYTHFVLSYADSCGPIDNGPNSPPGNGRTLSQFIDTCLLVKSFVPYAHVMIGSKYFQPANMTAAEWASFADPIMDALIKAKAVDEFALGWEWNLWNVPGAITIDAFRHCGQKARAAGLSSWMHYSPHVTSWFADGDPRGRFGFYDDLQGDVDGIDYQSQGPYWSPAMLQARIVDSLWQFGERGNDVKFRFWEDLAAWMWSNDAVTVPVDDGAEQTVSVTPEDANLRGYIACCTIDDVKHTDAVVHGYGNGGRQPPGTRL